VSVASVASSQQAPAVVAPPPGNPRFPLFDSLRAIAATSILVKHAAFASEAARQGWYGAVVDKLFVGVTIFFVISGFLLYRPFVRARFHGVAPPRVRDYARRRALRIVPAYWVALTVMAVWIDLPGVLTHDFWRYYGFLQVYGTGQVLLGLSQAWSLAVEASFYVALPLFALVMTRLARRLRRDRLVRVELLVLALLAVASLAVRDLSFGRGSLLPTTLAGSFDWFALGMALAVVSVAWEARSSEPRVMRLVTRHPGACWLVAGAAFLLIVLAGAPENVFPPPFSRFQWFFEHVLAGIVGVFLVLPAVFGDRAGGLPRRVLRLRALGWLGLISYGIFLWQSGFITQFHNWGADDPARGTAGFLLLTLTAFAGTVVAAALSYYLVERPFLRLKDPPGRRRPAIRAASRRERARTAG
jgi:peptidoglycan/LPS O-acetylase OafA/YrhL